MVDTTSVRSNLFAGVLAFVIYVVIALATGSGLVSALGIGVLVGVGTFVVAFLISLVIRARR